MLCTSWILFANFELQQGNSLRLSFMYGHFKFTTWFAIVSSGVPCKKTLFCRPPFTLLDESSYYKLLQTLTYALVLHSDAKAWAVIHSVSVFGKEKYRWRIYQCFINNLQGILMNLWLDVLTRMGSKFVSFFVLIFLQGFTCNSFHWSNW